MKKNIIDETREFIESTVSKRETELAMIEKAIAEQDAKAAEAETAMKDALDAVNATAYATAMHERNAALDAVAFFKARLDLLTSTPLADNPEGKKKEIVEYVAEVRDAKLVKVRKLVEEIAAINAEFVELKQSANKVITDWNGKILQRNTTSYRIVLPKSYHVDVWEQNVGTLGEYTF